MDVLNIITINDASFKVTNDSNYPLDRYLDSSYGFELYFKNKRGIEQNRWLKTLQSDNFDKILNLGRTKTSIHYSETRATTLDIHKYITRPFVIHWVLGNDWYGLGFDTHEFILQNNEGNMFLPEVIL